MRTFDTIILGQGIAGTALAWKLLLSGQTVLVIDRNEQITSSKIAAGLITPITGKRLVKNWKYDVFWPPAIRFYRQIESIIGESFLDEVTMLRVFQSLAEQELFFKKQTEYGDTVQRVGYEVLSAFHAPLGGFEMLQAGRLLVSNYLDSSRTEFLEQDCFVTADMNVQRDLQIEHNRVLITSLNVQAAQIVFCQGHTQPLNTYFDRVPYNPAKGEILTVRIPGLKEHRTIHAGIWLVPLGNELFRCGSTYEWEQIDSVPTAEAKESICRRLKLLIRQPFEVVEHQAAVRPVLMDSRPRIGLHPEFPQLAFFNGLGSKGSLQAPLLAAQLADGIINGTPIDPEFGLIIEKKTSVPDRSRQSGTKE